MTSRVIEMSNSLPQYT